MLTDVAPSGGRTGATAAGCSDDRCGINTTGGCIAPGFPAVTVLSVVMVGFPPTADGGSRVG